MMRVAVIIFLGVMLSAFSCTETKDCCVFPLSEDGAEAFGGSWLLFERGYSLGAGYVTVEVPATPAQLLAFDGDKVFASNISVLEAFTYYAVLDDPNSGDKVLALLTEDPGLVTPDVETVQHSYTIEWSASALTLHYRWCIEGCHISLKKIE